MIDDEEYATEAIIDEFPLDPIAARAESFFRGLLVINSIEDEALRKEGVMMLSAIRRSFKTLPAGELASVPGGKP